MRRILVVTVMWLVALTAVVRAQSDEIASLRDEYRAAVGQGDAARVADLFAEDAMLVSPEGVFMHGRQEIARYFADVFTRSNADAIAFTSATAESKNGFGSETGRFEERVTGTSGAYVLIYRQDSAGRWRIAIEIRSQASQAALAHQ